MTGIGAVNSAGVVCLSQVFSQAPAGSVDPMAGLPSPLLTGTDPTDLLAMIMAAVERMSSDSIDQTEKQIRADQKKLEKALNDYLDKIAASIAAAKKAKKKKKGGFFKRAARKVAKTCAKAVGSTADFLVDAVKTPVKVTIAVAKGIDNPIQAFTSALLNQLDELTSNGSVANSVEKFTQGVLEFSVALVDFVASYSAACLSGALNGDPLALKAIKDQAIELWDDFSDNILQNEGFWDIVEPLAKAAMIASAAATGGILGPVAVGVLIVLEVDARTGFLDDAVGKDAAPWLRLGLAVGASLAMSGSGDMAQVARFIQGGTAILGGLAAVDTARLDLKEAKRVKEEMFRQAEMQETLNQIRQLHDKVDELIDELEEKSEERSSFQSSFQSLAQTQTFAMSATIIRA